MKRTDTAHVPGLVISVVIAGVLSVGVSVLADGRGAGGPQGRDAQDQVAKCPAPYGTVAINEPTDEVLMWLRGYQLGSPSSLLRVFAQQSNCFIVVERGAAMQNLQQERRLASSGEFQEGQNVGAGQMVAADFVMQPAMQFSDNNAGGAGGVIGALGRRVGLGGGGALKFKEAQTSITVSSTRSSVQVAAAEGKARQRDFSLGALGIGGPLLAAAGAYTSTAEGKVLAASLLDNFNAIVASITSNASLRPMSPERVASLVSGVAEAGRALEKGQMVAPKINGVRLHSTPDASSATIATLRAGEPVLFLGGRNGSFIQVQRGSTVGWVDQTGVAPTSAASGAASAGTVLNEGDLVRPKIDGVRLMKSPSETATVVATLKKADELVFLGQEDNGFIKVQGTAAEGWVKRTLVTGGL